MEPRDSGVESMEAPVLPKMGIESVCFFGRGWTPLVGFARSQGSQTFWKSPMVFFVFATIKSLWRSKAGSEDRFFRPQLSAFEPGADGLLA